MNHFEYDICIIGGCGHVGLPLALAFANKEKKVAIYDINEDSIDLVKKGIMPFLECNAENILKRVVNKNLIISSELEIISKSKFIVIVIGTPIDKHLNPELRPIKSLLSEIKPYLKNDQHVVLRSTVYPNTTEKIKNELEKYNKTLKISFCPERIAEGKALEEFSGLPQIVSSFSELAIGEAKELFKILTDDIIVLTPLEAELAKLFTNSWRYIQFSIANQFYMLADQHEVDFYKIFNAIKYKYPRAKDFPKPGFTAGPCLLKDTMQISSFSNNSFFLGQSAMMVNEGMPNYIVQKLKKMFVLRNKSIGILGMAFKADIDDIRDSLSYKLKKILEFEAKQVYCTDEYVVDESLLSLSEVLDKSEVIILGVPHSRYKDIKIDPDKILIDIWDFIER